MTIYPDLFLALAAPFEGSQVKSRPQAKEGSRRVFYITSRTAMNRLDEVLGPENWWDEYFPSENSVLCRLTIRLPDGSTLTKCDAGGYAGMSDAGDDDKSGFSDSFKRAAVKFGVARYLYRDGVPAFVAATPKPPAKPAPEPEPEPGDLGWVHNAPEPPPINTPSPDRDRLPSQARPPSTPEPTPKTGKALYRWAKEVEDRERVGLLRYLSQWGKLQGFPARLVDWDGEQAASGHAEASRKLCLIRDAEAVA